MRRQALLLALVLGGAAVASQADQVSRLTGAEAVEAWVRLKGDAGGATTYEWVSGTAFGVPADGPSVELFRMESVTVRRFEKIGAEVTSKETMPAACIATRSRANLSIIS